MIPAGLLTESIEVYKRSVSDNGNGTFSENYTFYVDARAQIIRLNGAINTRNELQVNNYDIGFKTRYFDVKSRDKIRYNGLSYIVDYVEPYPLNRGLNIYCFTDNS